jgi:hypothetical protein
LEGDGVGICLRAVIRLGDVGTCVDLYLLLVKVLSLMSSSATIVSKSIKEILLLLLLEVIASVFCSAISIIIVLFIVNKDKATPVLELFSGGYILCWLYPE